MKIHLSQLKVQLAKLMSQVSRVTQMEEVWHQVPSRSETAFLGSFWVLHWVWKCQNSCHTKINTKFGHGVLEKSSSYVYIYIYIYIYIYCITYYKDYAQARSTYMWRALFQNKIDIVIASPFFMGLIVFWKRFLHIYAYMQIDWASLGLEVACYFWIFQISGYRLNMVLKSIK